MKKSLFSIFDEYPIVAALSQKEDGPMQLARATKEVKENRERFLKNLDIDPIKVVAALLAHSNQVRVVSQKESGKKINRVDGLLTRESDLFLSITAADCLPVYMHDPEQDTTGLIHAGWPGIVGNIIRNAAQAFKNLESKPENILVGIGPSIGVCHYEIKEDLIKKIPSRLRDTLIQKNGKMFWDLKKSARIQLIEEGIKSSHIEISPLCTFCDSNQYFSYRREQLEDFNVMMAVIGRTN